MGFLQGLKRTFNIAGSKIVISTEDQIYSQNDTIKGDIIITAPEYTQNGHSICLELKEFWTETRSNGKTTTTVTVYKTHEKVDLHGKFDFEPGTEHKYSFEVQLPRNCRVSTASTGWNLTVSLDIPMALDPVESICLQIDPAEEFLAMVEACEEKLMFRENVKSRSWHPKTERTYLRLLPPEVLKSEIDYIALDIIQGEDGSVAGDIIFNVQEKSIIDYFKAIIGRDKIRKPFTLTASQMNAQGESNEVAECVMSLMKEVIDQREA